MKKEISENSEIANDADEDIGGNDSVQLLQLQINQLEQELSILGKQDQHQSQSKSHSNRKLYRKMIHNFYHRKSFDMNSIVN